MDPKNASADGMSEAFELAGKPGYLGSPAVVAPILARLFDAITAQSEAIFMHGDVPGTADAFLGAAGDFAAALAGLNPEYTPMPLWHSVEGLGAECIAAFGLDAESCEGEGLVFIVGEAAGAISLVLGGVLASGFKKAKGERFCGRGDEAFHGLMADFFAFCLSTLIGTRQVEHPGVVAADFAPGGVRWLKRMDPASYEELMQAKAMEMLQELLATASKAAR